MLGLSISLIRSVLGHVMVNWNECCLMSVCWRVMLRWCSCWLYRWRSHQLTTVCCLLTIHRRTRYCWKPTLNQLLHLSVSSSLISLLFHYFIDINCNIFTPLNDCSDGHQCWMLMQLIFYDFYFLLLDDFIISTVDKVVIWTLLGWLSGS